MMQFLHFDKSNNQHKSNVYIYTTNYETMLLGQNKTQQIVKCNVLHITQPKADHIQYAIAYAGPDPLL